MDDLEIIVEKGVADGLPATFVVPLPSVGGYQLKDLRRLCHQHGSVRFMPYAPAGDKLEGLAVTVDSEVEPPLLALAMLVRDDVVGLERAIISAISQIDEIVIVVDGRSVAETEQMAQAYADKVIVFEASDIELSQANWDGNKIHFANARNLGRAQVQAPWTLIVDADEILYCHVDLRALLRELPSSIGAVNLPMGTDDFLHTDGQRLALTKYRFHSPMHNQLPITGAIADVPLDVRIIQDTTLRSDVEMRRREVQRDEGIEQLAADGRKGDMSALFHAAKHYIGHRNEKGVSLTEYYRLRTEIHGAHESERVWLALSAAALYFEKKDFRRAEQWGVRGLLDGPRLEAFVMLGDIAEAEGDLNRARSWYECACAVEAQPEKFAMLDNISCRFDRRDDLRKRLMRPREEFVKVETSVPVVAEG